MNLPTESRREQVIGTNVLESLVIPCFNEEGNMAQLGQKLRDIINDRHGLEIILVDNGSSDATRSEITALMRTTPRVRLVCVADNIGYGNGIKAGLLAAKGSAVGWTHADLQTDPNDAVKAFDLYRSRNSAFIKGKRVGRAWGDRIFSMGMAVIASVIFQVRLSEINAQPTVCPVSLREKLLSGPDDFSFDIFAMISARQHGLNEFRFPVYFGLRYAGHSSWNVSLFSRWRLVARTLRYCFRLRMRGLSPC